MAKYKIGSTVFVYIDPRNLTDPTEAPVFEGKVVQITRIITEDEEAMTEETRYRVSLTDTIDETSVREADLFPTWEKAKDHAHQELEKMMLLWEERRNQYIHASVALGISEVQRLRNSKEQGS